MKHRLQCIGCSRILNPARIPIYACPACGDLLHIVYDYDSLGREFRESLKSSGPLSVWRYHRILPVSLANAISIAEGGTGLSKSERLARSLRMSEVYFKNDGQNPTGSFKDRGMTVAISRAVEIGADTVLCASTGNTSASMAAYAAKAGLKAIVLIPKGKIAMGKLLQAMVHGSKICQVEGNFDKALERAKKMTAGRRGLYLVNSINPYRLEGQKTLAFEVWEQLGRRIPDVVIVPVGNAGNISAIWKGFQELRRTKLTARVPRMIGVQASGAAPLADAYAKNRQKVIPWPNPETIASAIRIGAPASWKKALRAVRESRGAIIKASDEEITAAQRLLANHEGIFAEPASAASVAGLLKARKTRLLTPRETVVCVITCHGLKDQKAAADFAVL
jgi:threonine synthase